MKAAQEAQQAAEAAHKEAALRLQEAKGAVTSEKAAEMPEGAEGMSVEELQAALEGAGVEAEWDPTQGKEVLLERLQVRSGILCFCFVYGTPASGARAPHGSARMLSQCGQSASV